MGIDLFCVVITYVYDCPVLLILLKYLVSIYESICQLPHSIWSPSRTNVTKDKYTINHWMVRGWQPFWHEVPCFLDSQCAISTLSLIMTPHQNTCPSPRLSPQSLKSLNESRIMCKTFHFKIKTLSRSMLMSPTVISLRCANDGNLWCLRLSSQQHNLHIYNAQHRITKSELQLC